jgi:hypothetical protein
MYVATVLALLFVIPLASMSLESLVTHGPLSSLLFEKWYVFWAVGVRLLLAGLRQILQPAYTATVILGLKDPSSNLVVRELGIANTALGVLAVASLIAPPWRQPAVLAGVVFYGLAGINHACHSGRTRLQNLAMVTDILASIVLAALLVTSHDVGTGTVTWLG